MIRVYRRQPAAMPLRSFDVAAFLRLDEKGLETDLEGAARIGDRICWMASHGRNAKGEASPNRWRFFATTVTVHEDVVTVEPIGAPYGGLLSDLQADPRLRPIRRDGLALLVPLLNPAEVIEGGRAKLGDPIRLDLGGLGVRSMGWSNGRYLIIAGHHDDDGVSRLYEWAGPGAKPSVVEGITFAGSNPEGVAFEAENGAQDVFVLSDDGTLEIDGVDCKKLRDPAKRRFRGYRLDS